jgi:hypothetical protein
MSAILSDLWVSKSPLFCHSQAQIRHLHFLSLKKNQSISKLWECHPSFKGQVVWWWDSTLHVPLQLAFFWGQHFIQCIQQLHNSESTENAIVIVLLGYAVGLPSQWGFQVGHRCIPKHPSLSLFPWSVSFYILKVCGWVPVWWNKFSYIVIVNSVRGGVSC